MRIGIITNPDKDPYYQSCKDVATFILEHGHTPIIMKDASPFVLDGVLDGVLSVGDTLIESEAKFFEVAEIVITLGGDGTFLRVAALAAENQTPILGINLGTLGFMTDAEMAESTSVLEKVLKKDYTIENRMMLEADITDYSKEEQKNKVIMRPCLNEVCLTHGFTSNILAFDLFVNNNLVDHFRGDGILVSTPTGSTAYNLSCGGPIVEPNANLMCVTAICPHISKVHSFVISSSDKVKIVPDCSRNDALLVSDGYSRVKVKNGDSVNISCSKFITRIIRTHSLNFYDILRCKLIGDKFMR